MQGGQVLLDRPDLSQVDWIVPDGEWFGGCDVPAFVAAHRRQSGEDTLVRALPPCGGNRPFGSWLTPSHGQPGDLGVQTVEAEQPVQLAQLH